MADQSRAAYTAKLAERGLVVRSFDGHTLTVTYNPEQDPVIQEGHGVELGQLLSYAVLAMNDLPGDPYTELFPGIRSVSIDPF